MVFANDHVALTRAFIRVSRQLGIKTMYVQHCSVGRNFPPLEFSYNFLDGEESLIKYMTFQKPLGMVYLSGNSRFDVCKEYLKKVGQKQEDETKNIAIGIASNALDNEDSIKKICKELIEYGYTDITIRPHPGIPFDPSWYIYHGVKYSDSNQENPFAFISKMDYVLAGECGIHLDVMMMRKRAIYFNTHETPPKDVYEFIKNGIVRYADTIKTLIEE